ncbi:gliding motility-associated C-terminal domain-containing protein, partial [bacterium]|nr:gliding motility-associated C-terminal domain-containing protein [bacterium]
SISASASSGTTPYTYSWDPAPAAGQNSATASGLPAGNYSVTITDATGCAAVTATIVTEPTVLTANITANVSITGAGGSDGSATVAGSGGTPGYTYFWSNVQTGATAVGLTAGVYCVTVTDANLCEAITCVTIIEPAPLALNPSANVTSCFGGSDGMVTTSAAGGISPYSYTWLTSPSNVPVGNTITVTGLSAGSYFVSVTDANGITTSSSLVTINEPSAVTASLISSANINCNGDCNGNAVASATGGTSPYTFEWSDGQTNPTAVGLCVGGFSVSVLDDNDCPANTAVTITGPTALSLTLNPTNLTCFNAGDGSVTSTVAGGTSGYTYFWSNVQTTANISGLTAGIYCVTVTDANLCEAITCVTLTQPTELVLNGDSTQSTCGQADGSAIITIVQGDPNFTYQWDALANNQTTPVATGIAANVYTVTVTDGNGCTESYAQAVTDFGSPTINVLTQTPVSCNGASDGFAQVSVVGGTLPHTYIWNTTPVQTSASATGLPAGTWTATMTDGTGCVAAVAVVIPEPTLLVAGISSFTDVTCFGYTNGTATVVGSGGTTPYTYTWNNNNQTNSMATGLAPGNYVVAVTDDNNCTANVSVTIGEPAQITLNTSVTDAFCLTSSGQICVGVTNGVPPLSYLWSDGQTGSCGGSYFPGVECVTVTDFTGCVANICATIGNIPAGTAVIAATTNVSCFGENDGTASASMSGGITPYTYSWSPAPATGQTSNVATGLTAGDYIITVMDDVGCIAIAKTTITEPLAISISTTVTNNQCFQSCDGRIVSTVTGGTSPYTYLWNDSLAQTGAVISQLCAGSYTLTITDFNACTHTSTDIINEPTALNLDSTVVNSNCLQDDGSICILANGGMSPYTFTWPSGQNTTNCSTGLYAGPQNVTVTDDQGCDLTINAVITDLDGPAVSIISITDVDCNGNSSGSAIAVPAGGSGNYFYDWNNGIGNTVGNNPLLNNITAGSYSVDVEDANTGCVVTETMVINEPTALALNISGVDPRCFGSADGAASVVVAGGVQGYTYQWNTVPIGTSAATTGLMGGIYTVTILDANNCPISGVVTLTNPLPIAAAITTTDAQCFNDCNGIAIVEGSNGFGGYFYEWSNFQISQTAFNLCAGSYYVTLTDYNGCSKTENVTIGEPAQLHVLINNFGDINCFGGTDGFVQAPSFGGVPPYAYNWSTGISTTATATGLSANTWSVTVTDDNACSVGTSQQLTQPSQLNAAIIASSNVSCFGACDGSATVSASGGTPTGGTPGYFYQWDANGLSQQSATAINLCANTGITVTITDNSFVGCQTTASVNISEPNPIIASANITSSNCLQADGSIQITVGGGIGPYVPSWNDSLFPNAFTVYNVSAGAYCVTILDAQACEHVECVNVNDILGPSINYLNHTDVSCFGSTDGIINTNVTGGTSPYQTVWTDQGGNTIAANTFGVTFLAGNEEYCETVIDAVGCQASLCQIIAEPSEINSAVINPNNVSCFGGNDGSAMVQAGGGTSPYTFAWPPTSQTTTTVTGLPAGPVAVETTDDNGCTGISFVTITAPQVLAPIATVDDVNCFGESDGSVVLTTTGGTGFYTYNWNPNTSNSNSNAVGLPIGTYNVTVTDANGCTNSLSAIVNQPTQLTASIQATDATCTLFNGSASISAVSGGTPDYEYLWSNGETSTLATGLYPTDHSAVVTDVMGCSIVLTVTVIDQAGPTINGISVTNPNCFGDCDGTATASVSGGTTPFVYHWNDIPQQDGNPALMLCADNYCVTVTDNNGCAAADCATIVQPELFTASSVASNYTPCAGEDITISASHSGGTGPYTNIVWYNAASGFGGYGPHNVSPVPNSIVNYPFTITDANGCFASDSATIIASAELLVDMPDTVETCIGNPVLISSTGFGGTAIVDYQWTWSTGETAYGVITSAIDVAPTDTTTYLVTLEDGCSDPASNEIVVVVNPIPTPAFGVLDSDGCPPFEAFFNGNSSMDGSTLEWDFNGDGIVDHVDSNLTAGLSTNTTYTYEESGLYSVGLTVVSSNQCTSTISIIDYIDIYASPVASFETPPVDVTLINPVVELNATASFGVDSLYMWDFNDPFDASTGYGVVNEHVYSDTGWYSIELDVVNIQGCHDYDTLDIYINPAFALYAPNAFTPNDDNVNDGFRLQGVGVDETNFELFIYNRWGERIFYTTDFHEAWDGTINFTDELAPSDAYVWKAFAKRTGTSNKTEPAGFIGTVTVVR